MKLFIKLFLIACFSTVLIGCEEEDNTYTGPLRVEFSANANSQYYNSRFYYHNYNIAPTIGSYNVQVQLIGGHQGKDLVVNYKVASEVYYIYTTNRVVAAKPSGVEGTDYKVLTPTAIAGTDYELSSGTTSIPAGSSFGQINMTINVNNDTSKRFFIVLEDSNDLIANNQTNVMMVILGRLTSTSPSI